MAAHRGADVLADVIEAHGNSTVFSLGGHTHGRLLEALDTRGVRIVGGRHESAVVAAADGYSRVLGRAGVAVVIYKQGVANAYAGLITARYAGSPVVVIVARNNVAYDDPRSEEEISQFAGLRDVVKWARTVPHQDRLGEYLDAAYRIAEAGQPGPVLLAVAGDQLDGAAARYRPEPAGARARQPSCSAEDAAVLAGILAAAERPVVVAGTGARWSRAGAALTRLAEDFGLPVIGRELGRGLVDETTPSGWSWARALPALAQSDAVLALGSHLDLKMHYGLAPRFHPEVKILQVDAAAEVLGGPRNVVRTVVADPADTARALHGALGALPAARRDPGWVAGLALPGAEGSERSARAGSEQPLAAELARQASLRLPAEGIMVVDGAAVYGAMQTAHSVTRTAGWIDHQPLGSMGIGTGLAVGAAAAAAEEAAERGTARRPVMLFTGDGAFGYFCAELSTMSRHGLPVVTVVGNDGAWGTERHGQLLTLGRVVNTELGVWDYAKLAEALGCEGRTVTRSDELEAGLDWAAAVFAAGPAGGRPRVLNVELDRDAGLEQRRRAMAGASYEALFHPDAGIYPDGPPLLPAL